MQIQKVIEQLGFSAREAKVYLTSLILGECHVSYIAEKLKLPRTSIQVIVNKLSKKGLMHFYVMRRYKYWVAESPERLLHNLKKSEDILKEAMPRLIAFKRDNGGRKTSHDSSQSLGFFRMLADASELPILITNESIEIKYTNSAWEKQFGYSLEEVRGENPKIFESGDTPSEVNHHIRDTLKNEKMFQTDEVMGKKKDGTTFKLITTIFPVRHNGFLFYIQILDNTAGKKRTDTLKERFLKGNGLI